MFKIFFFFMLALVAVLVVVPVIFTAIKIVSELALLAVLMNVTPFSFVALLAAMAVT